MSTIRQGGFLASNHAEVHTGSGAGTILALGGAAAMVAFAVTVGMLAGGAIALAVIVLASVAAGCLCIKVLSRVGLEVAHWRKYGILPPKQPLLTINRPLSYEQLPPPPARPRMTVTRADYPDRVYPGERDTS